MTILANLKQGSTGTEVKELQLILQRLGYNPGTADGIFGPKTMQAVIQFQKDTSLTPDGIVGPVTWLALQNRDQGYRLYTIQAGDTFYKIALTFNLNLSSLLAANPGVDPNKLNIGQKIWLPTSLPKLVLTKSVGGWVPSWLQTQAFRSVQNHPDIFSNLSPFWYEVESSGEIIKYTGAEDNSLLSFARTHAIKLFPLISNAFSSEQISAVLNDPLIRRNHVANIVKLLSQLNYDGIDINYENLFVKDKEVFVIFLQELKTALSPIGKQLIVTVHAKTDPVGDWTGAEAHDYIGIGQTADFVRIMGYDFHWFGGEPGPIAPADWIDNVLAYAVSTIPKSKIVLGLPTYGYDWPLGQEGKGITYSYAVSTAKRYNAPITEDAQQGPHFTYTADGVAHEVWFIDANSFAALLDLVNHYDLNGIVIWYLGAEDPKIYDVIQAKFKASV
ncbi:glycosyl hydrolase family 18 protein [Desulfosporosinus sp. PR]|uniref:glycosyl hydrolase family 18 protein n=1 Tax=Candidatus Desulfosporosinus nitrosoreducens TaxID=3401928 RepID=UPI0027EC82D4|nr:glycosyl hydrolase family 18 protein [Desulfosporosinus sp. PR]MDQ7094827.1 glycosyl hydrolase family 18 protein [Desulfosporosinus sp. PR]